MTIPAPSDPILILGAPRSGTTWLAKIVDSHPGVLYRHEPDEIHPATTLPPERLLQVWVNERGTRTASKRPFFRKSYQSAVAFHLRTALAYALNGASRLPPPFNRLGTLPVPDLADTARARLAIKSVRWCDGVGRFARALPDSRVLLILRHPCGQVASVMRGARQKRFDLREEGTDMPFDEAFAVASAERHGVERRAFQSLPDAAKYAWAWVAFNEAALAGVETLPNLRVVIYEELCADPIGLSHELLGFAGLTWNAQTEDFLRRSTSHDGPAGYYAVFRSSIAAADGWRKSMAPADQQAVTDVVRATALARFWPDLSAPKMR